VTTGGASQDQVPAVLAEQLQGSHVAITAHMTRPKGVDGDRSDGDRVAVVSRRPWAVG
jgi:hypothetical protein